MSSPNITPELKRRLGEMREKYGDTIKIDDVTSVVESVMATMRGDFSAADLELFNELEALSVYIHAAKADIAALRPDAVRDEYLPTAADELDAIVAATETATNTIMDAAEAIEGVMGKLDDEHANVLMEATTQIFEACGFQDITGQRITKVVKALKDIEDKIDALVDAFGSEIDKYKADHPEIADDEDKPITDADLLGGPQMEGEAKSQKEIDALLASFD